MPRIDLIKPVTTKKIDITPFFKHVMGEGETAFITLQRMGKYEFSYLLNKGREGYINYMYASLREFVNDETKEIPEDRWNEFRMSMTEEDLQRRLNIEYVCALEYFKKGIHPTEHNFIDENDKPIELDGEWFYKTYGELTAAIEEKDKEMTLATHILNEIMSFNHSGLVLGEQTAQN